MTKTVYYWFKPGVDRDFSSTTIPSEAYVKALKDDGYKILKLSFDIPKDILPKVDAWVGAHVEEST